MEMKRTFLTSLLALAVGAAAQQQLREVTVVGRRPLREVGVQETRFDSAALKENIALSMADVLTFNSGVFVKNHGRATLSTVAFRGTSPSHTRVTWNGMEISSPMLGSTDFSTIPSYFIDSASLLHGSSSVEATGAGLGGLVRLGTLPDAPEGLGLQYVQGIGSYTTFDEFVRLTWRSGRWTTSTRAVCSTSPNDYHYTNHDKKENIYDSDHNIIGSYYPRETNRSGSFKDIHVLQEVYYDNGRGDLVGLNAWYSHSNRELPLLTTDYAAATDADNRQRDNSLRAVLSWTHNRGNGWSTDMRAGYIHTSGAYDYRRSTGAPGSMATMTRSRTRVNTFYGHAKADMYVGDRTWLFSLTLSAHQHLVRSMDYAKISVEGNRPLVGYDKGRIEFAASASAKWQPTARIGLSLVLRQQMAGTAWAPLIPAFLADAVLWPRIGLKAKASVSRNYRFPSLNDLYFMPGGNPDLRSERGLTYDASLSFATGKSGVFSLSGSAGWFDSRIDNWILWLPTTKGYFSPRNVLRVHAYGIEASAALTARLHPHWLLSLSGSYTWSPSINRGQPASEADKSVGRQLPYVPRHSASATARLDWRTWSLLYKWAHYSQRYTMSSNESTISGHLPPYYMSNISLGKTFEFRWAGLDLRLAINNLFDEDYLSVLSHPMPGINFEFFIGITPKL